MPNAPDAVSAIKNSSRQERHAVSVSSFESS